MHSEDAVMLLCSYAARRCSHVMVQLCIQKMQSCYGAVMHPEDADCKGAVMHPEDADCYDAVMHPEDADC